MAGIIGIPGRLQSEWVAAFARNPRPTSSEYALRARSSAVRAQRSLVQIPPGNVMAAADTNWACAPGLW